MRIEEVKEIARKKGVKTWKMKKTELIRAIQEAEGNPTCFDIGKAADCGQANCLWRGDCK